MRISDCSSYVCSSDLIAVEQVRSVTVGRSGLEAGVENAKAASGLAVIDLRRTEVRAPRSGRLSEVSVRVGQLVNPGTQLMYLVTQTHWVVANFKEAQNDRKSTRLNYRQ